MYTPMWAASDYQLREIFDFEHKFTKLHLRHFLKVHFMLKASIFVTFSIEIKVLLMIPNHNHGSIEQSGVNIGRIGYVI